MTGWWIWPTAALAVALIAGAKSPARDVGFVADVITVTGSTSPRPDGRSRERERRAIAAAAIATAEAMPEIPLAWLLAVGYYESRFRPEARSSSNAVGVWQQKPQYSATHSDNGQLLSDRTLMSDLPQAARVASRNFQGLLRRIDTEGRLEQLEGAIPPYANRWWLAAGYYNQGRSGFHNNLADRGGWRYADDVTKLAVVFQGILNGAIPRDQWRAQVAAIKP